MLSYGQSSNSTQSHLLSDGDREPVLLRAAREGCGEAYAELCSPHRRRLFRAILRITKNREDAEDVLQDAMLKAYIHLAQFDCRAQFSTWLIRIGINCALVLVRKRKNRRDAAWQAWLQESDLWFETEVKDTRSNPEERYLYESLALQVRNEIVKLPPPLRQVIELQHERGYSVSDIAAVSGISVAAAKARLFRARGAIVQTLRSRPQQLCT